MDVGVAAAAAEVEVEEAFHKCQLKTNLMHSWMRTMPRLIYVILQTSVVNSFGLLGRPFSAERENGVVSNYCDCRSFRPVAEESVSMKWNKCSDVLFFNLLFSLAVKVAGSMLRSGSCDVMLVPSTKY